MGVPGNIRISQGNESVGGVSYASQGSNTVFQQRTRCTLVEMEQDEVVARKSDREIPGLKTFVANQIVATMSLLRKFLGLYHLQSKMQLVRLYKRANTSKASLFQTWRL